MAEARFCSGCGTELLAKARFCHNCGTAVAGAATTEAPSASARKASPLLMQWGIGVVAIVALVIVAMTNAGKKEPAPLGSAVPPMGGAGGAAPDISSMSPQERADRLFNRVMTLASAGKRDSAAFFAPMALASFEALAPHNAHMRYDMGLVALAGGEVSRASAQADTILRERPTHLLGLALSARVAEARGDSAAARAARQKLVDAEPAERAAALPEYLDHDADLKAIVATAKR